ncbi:Uncharacterised protein [Clostridium carnis]|uniref:Plasmid-related protein n=1 Tax=Clostridium carnis TaxID=1530 RepID=A0ABY6SNZ2_9CLOT|nr:hypothetical protein [Clostridium carnis]VDG69872.1 Uncharacterised protein [Clostridium carnis]
MDNQILELLQAMNSKLDQNTSSIESMKSEIKIMNTKIDNLEQGQKDIKITVDSIKSNIEEMTQDMHRIEIETAKNWADIAQLKAIR